MATAKVPENHLIELIDSVGNATAVSQQEMNALACFLHQLEADEIRPSLLNANHHRFLLALSVRGQDEPYP